MQPVRTNIGQLSICLAWIFALCAVVQGCSFSDSPQATSLLLTIRNNNTTLSDPSLKDTAYLSGKWEQVSAIDGVRLYKRELIKNQTAETPTVVPVLYMSAISQCGVKKSTSLKNSFRQLLVGFQKIIITDQQEMSTSAMHTLTTNFTAELDTSVLTMAALSVARDDCIFDYVTWSEQRSDNREQALVLQARQELLASDTVINGEM